MLVMPPDLPRVALAGVPGRLARDAQEARQRGDWEWLCVRLAGTVGEIAVFDPDHLCLPGWFGKPCVLGIELFHPAVYPNPTHEAGLWPQSVTADPDAPPAVAGRVAALHHEAWQYTGPITAWVTEGAARRPEVRHVIDAPQMTVRLVIECDAGTVLAQLHDPAEDAPVGAWVMLRAGRAELVTIALAGVAQH
jgi:hypothetical protein